MILTIAGWFAFLWTALVVVFGLSTILNGLVPLHTVLWLTLLTFAAYVQRHRNLFANSADTAVRV